MNSDDIQLSVFLTRNLRERARRVAKMFKTTTAALAREGLADKVEYLETKLLIEEERARAEKEKQTEHNTGRAPRTFGTSLLKPVIGSLAPAALGVEPTKTKNLIDLAYEQHARRVLAALDDPTEKRLRIAEVMATIKREAPLTHPSDREILENLERVVIELRSESTPQRREETEIVQTIDPSRVKTLGDV
jgi:hypothetical protein